MNFFAIKRFTISLSALLSYKDKYGCVLENIYETFQDKSDDELFNMGYRLNGNHPVARMIKFRVKSCGKNSKSSGFRVIAFINIKTKKFCFLDVYPKIGTLAKDNMKSKERKNCLNEFKLEQNNLYTVIFDKATKQISIHNPN